MSRIASRFVLAMSRFISRYRYIILTTVISLFMVLIGGISYVRLHTSYCSDATDVVEDFDIDLVINKDTETYKKLILYITRGRKRVKILIDGGQWIRLYFNKQPVVQVKYLYRVFKDPCRLAEVLRYTFGVPIEAVHIERNGVFVYSTDIKRWFDIKFNRFVYRSEYPKLPKGKEYTLEDKSNVNVLGFDEFFEIIKQYTFIDKIQQEGIFLEVFNSTRKVGYATYWARTFKILGFLVSRAGNYPELPDYSQTYDIYLYYTNDVSGSYTLSMVRRLLRGYRVFESSQRPPYLLTTGDIVLILLR